MLLVLAIIFGILPGFAWLIFYLQEDPHPEPRRLIVYVFLVGGIVTFLAVGLEIGYLNALKLLGWQTPIALLTGLAIIEEVLKFAATYASIHRSRYFDEAVDAMIYMVVASLGFATAENILFAVGDIQEGLTAGIMESSLIGGVFETISLRFVGATLLHTLASAIVGYYWALGIAQRREKHFIALGLLCATPFHSFFNFLIITYGPGQIYYSTLLLVIVAAVVLHDFEKIKGYPRQAKHFHPSQNPSV